MARQLQNLCNIPFVMPKTVKELLSTWGIEGLENTKKNMDHTGQLVSVESFGE